MSDQELENSIEVCNEQMYDPESGDDRGLDDCPDETPGPEQAGIDRHVDPWGGDVGDRPHPGR